jgi:hypothetical protein
MNTIGKSKPASASCRASSIPDLLPSMVWAMSAWRQYSGKLIMLCQKGRPEAERSGWVIFDLT